MAGRRRNDHRNANRLAAAAIVCAFGAAAAPGAWAESARKLARRANDFYRQERLQEAIDGYRDAIARDPDSPAIRYNLGTALARDGRADDAAQILEQAALAKSSYSADAWFNLGVTRAEQSLNRYPELRRLLEAHPTPGSQVPEEALAALPPDAIDRTIEGLERGQKAFRESIVLEPDNIQAKYNHEVTGAMVERLKECRVRQEKQQEKDGQEQKQNQDRQDDQDQPQNQNDQDQSGESGDRQYRGPQQDNGLEDDKQREQQEQKPPQPQPEEKREDAQQEKQPAEPLTPEQMDAMRLLLLLEDQRPEQFKKLFEFRGKTPPFQTDQDW